MTDTLLLLATTLGVAALSGVVPIVSLEIYVVGVVLLAGGVPLAVALGVACAIGQMVAKGLLYQAARRATNLGRGRYAASIDRARAMVERWRTKPLTLVFVSASSGLPPFYVVSLAAGILEVRFRAFLLVGTCGRALRFSAIAVIAAIA